MREIKFRAVMQRLDGVKYVSQAYSIDNNLSYLFDFENNRWDIFLEMITTEERFVELFPDDDEHLKGWAHIENIQYTGLKDKNGVEIYNKDIIRDGGRLWIVEISSLYGVVLILLKDKKITRPYVKFEKHLIDDFEVIGNVYENLELLKEIK